MDNSMIDLLRNPIHTQSSNNQLTVYVDNLAHDYNSLNLCLDVLNNLRNPEDQYAKFIALQIIERQMTYFPQIKNSCKTPLIELLIRICANELNVQPFVVNKILTMIVNLFMEIYLINWLDFFDQLHKLLSYDMKGITCYFKIMEYIHDELHFEARDQAYTVKQIQDIKEKMKETHISRFVDVIYKIIEFYSSTQSENVILAIDVFSKYSHWIDSSYSYNMNTFTAFFNLMPYEIYRDSVSNFICSLLDKGMSKMLKHQMITDIIFQLKSIGFYIQKLFLQYNGAKILVKICLNEMEYVEIEIKDKADIETNKLYFCILDETSSILFSLLKQDDKELFATILPFISKYILFAKKYQKYNISPLESELEIIWKRSLSYLQYSDEELEDGSSIDCARRLVKSILININNHYFIPENCILLDLIYKELSNLNNQTMTSLATLFKLLKELPEISSAVILKSPLNKKKLLDLIDIIFSNRIIECNDSTIKLLVLEILLRYDFIYTDTDLIWPKILDLFLSKNGIECNDASLFHQSIMLFTRFVHLHLTKIDNSCYDKIFAYFQPKISSAINHQPISSLSLDHHSLSYLFEIASIVIVTGALKKEQRLEYLNLYIFTPLLNRAKCLVDSIKLLPSLYTNNGASHDGELHPLCNKLNIILEYMVSSTKCFNGLSHVIVLNAESILLLYNDLFINIMVYFNSSKELSDTALRGLHRTVTCLGGLVFPSITEMFKHLHISQNVNLLEFFGFFINMCTKLKISNSQNFEECFFMIFPPLISSISTPTPLPSNELMYDEAIKKKRAAVQFFKLLLERDFIHEYVKKDESIIYLIIQFLVYEIHNTSDDVIIYESLSCLSLITLDVKCNKIVFKANDLLFFQTNFISPSLFILETNLKKNNRNTYKKVLMSITKILSNLDFNIVVSCIRNLFQSINGYNGYENICNMSSNQQEYGFIYRELESILNKSTNVK